MVGNFIPKEAPAKGFSQRTAAKFIYLTSLTFFTSPTSSASTSFASHLHQLQSTWSISHTSSSPTSINSIAYILCITYNILHTYTLPTSIFINSIYITSSSSKSNHITNIIYMIYIVWIIYTRALTQELFYRSCYTLSTSRCSTCIWTPTYKTPTSQVPLLRQKGHRKTGLRNVTLCGDRACRTHKRVFCEFSLAGRRLFERNDGRMLQNWGKTGSTDGRQDG